MDDAEGRERAEQARAAQRDYAERAALAREITQRNLAAVGQHTEELTAYRVRRRFVALSSSVFVAFSVVFWPVNFRVRDQILQQENWSLQGWAAGSFIVLFISAVMLAGHLIWWRWVLRTHPGKLLLEDQPDAPTTNRHQAFAGPFDMRRRV